MKSAMDLVQEAAASVESVDIAEALELAGDDQVTFIDIREGEERARGTIEGSLHVPRGLLEFYADSQSPFHEAAFSSGKKLVIFCASGGRSLLACKTLKEMGFDNVVNMAGGMQGWIQQEGPVAQD